MNSNPQPISLRLALWVMILTTLGIFYGKALLAIEDRFFVKVQPDIGVGPIILTNVWLTNQTIDTKQMALGTRYYIVLEQSTNANVSGEFRFYDSFRRNPWVILPPTNQEFVNCTFRLSADASRYWLIRRDVPAIMVLNNATNLALLPKF